MLITSNIFINICVSYLGVIFAYKNNFRTKAKIKIHNEKLRKYICSVKISVKYLGQNLYTKLLYKFLFSELANTTPIRIPNFINNSYFFFFVSILLLFHFNLLFIMEAQNLLILLFLLLLVFYMNNNSCY